MKQKKLKDIKYVLSLKKTIANNNIQEKMFDVTDFLEYGPAAGFPIFDDIKNSINVPFPRNKEEIVLYNSKDIMIPIDGFMFGVIEMSLYLFVGERKYLLIRKKCYPGRSRNVLVRKGRIVICK